MKWKLALISLTVLLVLSALLGLVFCQPQSPVAAAKDDYDVPFSVPTLFSYNAAASAQSGLPTFVSDNRTTLIVSYSDTDSRSLNRAAQWTTDAIETAYRNAGLNVSVSDLSKEQDNDALIYTYTIHLSAENGATVTRKYIRMTDETTLDISCGGNVKNEDAIDVDYAAVLLALS